MLIVGIISIVVCVLLLLFALLNMLSYYHVLDGSAELYDKLHQKMTVSFIIGIILAVIGMICLIIRSRL